MPPGCPPGWHDIQDAAQLSQDLESYRTKGCIHTDLFVYSRLCWQGAHTLAGEQVTKPGYSFASPGCDITILATVSAGIPLAGAMFSSCNVTLLRVRLSTATTMPGQNGSLLRPAIAWNTAFSSVFGVRGGSERRASEDRLKGLGWF